MKGALRFTYGLMWGLAFGAAIGLLLAPKSGQKFRQSIVDYANYVIEEGKRAGEVRRQELEQHFDQMRRAH